MAKYSILCLSTLLLLYTPSSSPSPVDTACNCSQSEDVEAVIDMYEAHQLSAVMAVKEIFDQQQNCIPRPKYSQKELTQTKARLESMDRVMRVMAKALTAPGVRTREAHVPRPVIFANVGSSANLYCKTRGLQQLESCIWGRTVNGQWELILVDKLVVRNGGRTDTEGVSYVGDGLNRGNCGIQIDSVSRNDLSDWSCTLVAETGDVFKGSMKIQASGPVVSIYFAVSSSIKAYSPVNSEVRTIITRTNEEFLGIAYDSLNDKLYWSADSKGAWSIYRASRIGSGLEITLQAKEYGYIYELAIDWITGNVYAASLTGDIFVCDSRRTSSASCAKVLTGQGAVEGIALNPSAGLMYFSSGNWIIRAEMDGSNRVPNFIQAKATRGIFIDLEDSRLYWGSTTYKLIQSSNLAGGDIRTRGLRSLDKFIT